MVAVATRGVFLAVATCLTCISLATGPDSESLYLATRGGCGGGTDLADDVQGQECVRVAVGSGFDGCADLAGALPAVP